MIYNNQKKHTQKNNAEMGVHIGSASIVMIFAVLCLTIFAALSFATAGYEQRLADKYADAAEAYYNADGVAEELYAQIYALLQQEHDADVLEAKLAELQVAVEYGDNRKWLHYSVPVDDTQMLRVTLLWAEHTLNIEQWRVDAAAQWEYEETLSVWDGSIKQTE